MYNCTPYRVPLPYYSKQIAATAAATAAVKEVEEVDATETTKHLNVLSIRCFWFDGIVLSSNMFCNQYKCPYLFPQRISKGNTFNAGVGRM